MKSGMDTCIVGEIYLRGRRLLSAVFLLLLVVASPCRAQCDSVALAKADTLLAHKKLSAAAKAYQKLVDGGSCMTYGYHGLAICAQKSDAPSEDVIGLINKSVALAPEDHVLLRTRSNMYMSFGISTGHSPTWRKRC